MKAHDETYDIASVTVVAIVSIIAVTMMVLNLAPEVTSNAPQLPTPARPDTVGQAYSSLTVPLGEQFDFASLDFDGNGRLDFYDYQAVLDGQVNCHQHDCDLNDDGYIDADDQLSFNLLVRLLYDYNRNGRLDRDDSRFLADILLGNTQCTTDYVCDLTGDGFVSSEDLSLYTSLLFNYELPELP